MNIIFFELARNIIKLSPELSRPNLEVHLRLLSIHKADATNGAVEDEAEELSPEVGLQLGTMNGGGAERAGDGLEREKGEKDER